MISLKTINRFNFLYITKQIFLKYYTQKFLFFSNFEVMNYSRDVPSDVNINALSYGDLALSDGIEIYQI